MDSSRGGSSDSAYSLGGNPAGGAGSMKLTCGMMAHNEDWIIGLTARAALMWCDNLIVAAHRCEDDTKAVLCDIGSSLVTVLDDEGEFHPLQFYKRMAVQAASTGSTHMAILDADEVLSANLIPLIRNHVASLAIRGSFEVPWIPIRVTHSDFGRPDLYPLGYDATGPRSNDKTAFAFCDPRTAIWPYRTEADYDVHGSRMPKRVIEYHSWVDTPAKGGLLHLQYVDERRQRFKEMRWKMMEMLRWPSRIPLQQLNEYYDSAVTDRGMLKAVPPEWWEPYHQWGRYLQIGGESWEEKEAKRLWAQYPGLFDRINTLGVL
jgi:hypothetical protein